MPVEKTLVTTLEELTQIARETTEVATLATQASRRLRIAVLIGVVILVVLMAGVLGVAVENRRTADTIVDCTTPEGECFKQSQARTAGVVQRILDGQIANTECRDEADVRACVEAKLAP